jgi:phenylacetate-CoA ligase
MPFFSRHLFEPLHALKNRSPKLHYWKKLEQTQYLPEVELREIQWQRLQHLVSFCWEQNDFYRERFLRADLTPDDIHSPDDLRRLPVLTKVEIRKHTPQMISKGFSISTLSQAKTGGSTGKSLVLYSTEECGELRNACTRRHDRWTGWEPGEPIAACWGNPHLPTTLKAKLKDRLLQPMIYLDTMSVNEDSIRTFVKDWHRVKPTLLYGHAHSLYLLAQFLKNLGIDSLRPRGILSTSMMLIPSERKVIEEVFGIKVTDRYGCEEVSLIGCECEKHEGLHLNIEHLYIEFLGDDGMPVAMGEPGRIVVTDLMNRAMPLIRYQVEDVGVPTDRKCSCGRGLPLMESVAGRVADFLIKRDGTQVAGVSLIENTLTKFVGIDQMQMIQNDYTHFEIRLVAGASYDNGVDRNLRDYLKKIFGDDVTIDILLVSKIPPELSGKFRFSICRIR